ncbi:DUF4407 domain-containing protein [Thiotrichales bacterium HSG1]|nr:DUF4407 domain-containing protein [Thiotrichales bacterium HSG1]
MFNFLIFCSGADKTILEKCAIPEIAKYESIGGTVFFTALFAMLSGGYALSTIFYKDDYISLFYIIFLGMIWGLFIFNLDRFIVSSMNKQDNVWDELKLATPRLVLAIFIAIIISTPLELKIFEGKINLQLIIDANEIRTYALTNPRRYFHQ